MSQLINFYQPQFHPQRDLLNANFLVGFAGGLLVVLALASYGVKLHMEQVGARLDNGRKQQTTAQEALNAVIARYPTLKVDPTLKDKIKVLEKRVEHNRQLLELLDSKKVWGGRGFSPYLVALSQAKVGGVWLEGIGVLAGGQELVLEGITLKPELLPELVAALSRQREFADRGFQFFGVEEPPPPEPAPEVTDKRPAAAAATPVVAKPVGSDKPSYRFYLKTVDKSVIAPPVVADGSAGDDAGTSSGNAGSGQGG